ncbi:MAG: hypothetical protein ACD_62C00247G0007 [uncultured bacterium]|nr:MAG: hypothetical protein ACD_62C00247G0007 [uncultured bacterium]
MSHALNVLNTQTHLALLTTALCRFPLSDRQQGRALTDEAHLLMTAPAWAGPDDDENLGVHVQALISQGEQIGMPPLSLETFRWTQTSKRAVIRQFASTLTAMSDARLIREAKKKGQKTVPDAPVDELSRRYQEVKAQIGGLNPAGGVAFRGGSVPVDADAGFTADLAEWTQANERLMLLRGALHLLVERFPARFSSEHAVEVYLDLAGEGTEVRIKNECFEEMLVCADDNSDVRVMPLFVEYLTENMDCLDYRQIEALFVVYKKYFGARFVGPGVSELSRLTDAIFKDRQDLLWDCARTIYARTGELIFWEEPAEIFAALEAKERARLKDDVWQCLHGEGSVDCEILGWQELATLFVYKGMFAEDKEADERTSWVGFRERYCDVVLSDETLEAYTTALIVKIILACEWYGLDEKAGQLFDYICEHGMHHLEEGQAFLGDDHNLGFLLDGICTYQEWQGRTFRWLEKLRERLGK